MNFDYEAWRQRLAEDHEFAAHVSAVKEIVRERVKALQDALKEADALDIPYMVFDMCNEPTVDFLDDDGEDD